MTIATSPAGLFNIVTALPRIRADRLVGVAATYFPGQELSDDYLWEKLCAAEAAAERALRVFFCPTEIVPQGSDEVPTTRWIEEPGYDYTPDMFSGDRWGLIETRQRPIISVTSMVFAYPGLTGNNFTVPPDWFRVDKKFGRINLVATTSVMTMPLNSFILSVLGGGRMVPLMLQIRYRAGLTDAATRFPDLLDLIKKMAVLSLLEDQFIPGSGSISADGLSQSISFEAAKYQEAIDHKLSTLRDAIHGQRVMVC